MAEKPLLKLMGDDLFVPVFGGSARRYVNLDNAATTLVLRRVWDRLGELMPWYGSIHRGDGFKSLISTACLDCAREIILRFAGGVPGHDALVLCSNTTSCINYLAARLDFNNDAHVIVSEHEHSSNLLPWLEHARVLRCPIGDDGHMDLEALERLLRQNRISLVTFSAASNVTGAIANTAEVARVSHRWGAKVAVDASQLAGHRPIPRGRPGEPGFLDYVVFCGHKMYAPFGVGVLLTPIDMLRQGPPGQPGGGTVRMICGDSVLWHDPPIGEQGGTPNYPGIIALAEACAALTELGFERIQEHEHALLQRLQNALGQVPGTSMHRLWRSAEDSLPIVPFSVTGHKHGLVSAYLGTECGIGVRAGHLCQFDLVAHLVGITGDKQQRLFDSMRSGSDPVIYGVVRASCGLGTSSEDIGALEDALQRLVDLGPRADYVQGNDGRFVARDWVRQPIAHTFAGLIESMQISPSLASVHSNRGEVQ